MKAVITMLHFVKKFFVLVICTQAFVSCSGQDNSHDFLTGKLDSILAATYVPNEPGASVLVYKQGNILLHKGYGLANFETKVPITPEHLFCIGSITKQFTAMAILMLEEQGKLSIEDPIHKYLPDYPNAEKRITIENLLTHTSGLVDVFEVQDWFSTWQKELTPHEFVDIFKDEPLLSEPGTQYHYSNFNYAILGVIIENISGEAYESFIAEKIFKPVGMNNTCIPKTPDSLKLVAKGYFKSTEDIQGINAINHSHLYAAGSIMSCTEDMLKWYLWLSEKYKAKDPKVLRVLTQYTLANGTKTNNGYGMMLYNVHQMPVAGNNGGMLGYTNYTLWMYENDLIVVILSNHRYEGKDQNKKDQYDVTKKAVLLTETAMGLSGQQERFIELTETALDRYVGMYKIEDEKEIYRIITRDGSQLYTKRSAGGNRKAMKSISENKFLTTDGSNIEFVIDNSGSVVESNWRKPDGTLSIGIRSDLPLPEEKKPVQISEIEFRSVLGVYKMMAVFDVNVYRNDSISIIVESKQRGKSVFFPMSPTQFFFADNDNTIIEFTKDKNGVIDGFKMTSEGRTFSAKKVEQQLDGTMKSY